MTASVSARRTLRRREGGDASAHRWCSGPGPGWLRGGRLLLLGRPAPLLGIRAGERGQSYQPEHSQVTRLHRHTPRTPGSGPSRGGQLASAARLAALETQRQSSQAQ